jgi:hypothetical protein
MEVVRLYGSINKLKTGKWFEILMQYFECNMELISLCHPGK